MSTALIIALVWAIGLPVVGLAAVGLTQLRCRRRAEEPGAFPTVSDAAQRRGDREMSGIVRLDGGPWEPAHGRVHTGQEHEARPELHVSGVRSNRE